MNKEINNTKIEDVIDEVEETASKKGLLSKAKDEIKKHGKVIASVGAVLASGLICYAIGHKIKGVDHNEIVSDVIDDIDSIVDDSVEN